MNANLQPTGTGPASAHIKLSVRDCARNAMRRRAWQKPILMERGTPPVPTSSAPLLSRKTIGPQLLKTRSTLGEPEPVVHNSRWLRRELPDLTLTAAHKDSCVNAKPHVELLDAKMVNGGPGTVILEGDETKHARLGEAIRGRQEENVEPGRVCFHPHQGDSSAASRQRCL